MLAGKLQGTRVYRAFPEGKGLKKDGTPRPLKRLGKIHNPVFTPDGLTLAGFMVRLPDIAGMVKQDDRFVALDALDVVDGQLVSADRKDSYDAAAAKRLGIDLDTCIIWTGMDVVTKSGKKLGLCVDADCNGTTGKVRMFSVTPGAASTLLVGTIQMPASFLRGYRSGCMVVDDEVADIDFSGGAAAKAAVVSKKVGDQVKKGARALDESGSKAVDKGSRALGKQLGRTKGMFKAFVSEYKEAAGSSKRKG